MVIGGREPFSDRYVVLLGSARSYAAYHFDLDQRQQAQQFFSAACQQTSRRVVWIDTANGCVLRERHWPAGRFVMNPSRRA